MPGETSIICGKNPRNKILWDSDGKIVKHQSSRQEIANFVHLLNHVSSSSMCAHACQLTNVCDGDDIFIMLIRCYVTI